MSERSGRLPWRGTAEALAEALFPAGERMPAADPVNVANTVAGYVDGRPLFRFAVATGLGWLALRYLLRHGGRLHAAALPRRQAFVTRLARTPLSGPLLRAVSGPFKLAWLMDERIQHEAGSRPAVDVPQELPAADWHTRIHRMHEFTSDHEIEADVVVIGSGAGGAAAALEFAEQGLSVVILEEGGYYDRRDFDGRLTRVIPKLYRAAGATATIGNAVIPVPIGRNVGGTTTINSGTCMRLPDSVLDQWRARFGLDYDAGEMAGWYERVEEILGVCEAPREHVGPIGDVIAEGARAMGFGKFYPLRRNAPGCQGQGLCQFGCPSDAKQSTNLSYIPRALEAGAHLYAGARVQRLLRRGRTVHGVRATGAGAGGRRVKLTVHAPHVVVAMGTFLTPPFLRSNGVRNPHLGRHLTIHPAGAVKAWFPDRNFRNSRSIPQGFGVADLADEGLMFEGGTIPFAGHGLMNNLYGEEFVRFCEGYQQTAYFGFMIRDTSEGRVRRGLHRDFPLLTYRMNRQDFALFRRGIETLARMYLRGGATSITIPGPSSLPTLHSEAELDAFMARATKPRDFLMTAYHPLGTARLAASAADGVCDQGHRVHGWQGLYVMDGSNLPSSLGVNPQVTIMAVVGRAARRLAGEIASKR